MTEGSHVSTGLGVIFPESHFSSLASHPEIEKFISHQERCAERSEGFNAIFQHPSSLGKLRSSLRATFLRIKAPQISSGMAIP